MQFENHVRNEYNKCATPEQTVHRIKQGLDNLGLKAQYSGVRVTDFLSWGRVWIESLHIICEGKGLSPELAEASAYAELMERLSAGLYYPAFEEQVRFHLPALYNDQTQRFLNYEWMPGYVRTHPDSLQQPHLRIEDLLARYPQLGPAAIQEIKDSEMAQHWVDGYSLMQDRMIKVPMKFVAYIHGSNGMAAGNVLEEALVQAACEVFERHTLIQVIRNEEEIPSIDPNSLPGSLPQAVMDFYHQNNVQVTIKDPSGDGFFPVIGALYTNHNLSSDRLEHKTFIPGASFNLDEALSRCFTEGIQGKTSLSAPRPQLDRPVAPKSEVDNYYLLMKCGVSPTDISFLDQGQTQQYQPRKAKDTREEIEAIARICRQLQTDCILLDHTHPVLQFPVVRVVIPGVSDFLPFLDRDILTHPKTKPSTAWKGEDYKHMLQSFFRD